MARTHEQTRLRKPTDRTAEVRAVDGEDLELLPCNVPHPAGSVGGCSVGGRHVWIAKRGQPRFALWKIADLPELNPRKISIVAAPRDRREEESNDRHGYDGRRHSVKQNSQLHEKPAPGHRRLTRRCEDRFSGHGVAPGALR